MAGKRLSERVGLSRAPIDSCCRRKGSEAGLRSKSSAASESNGAGRRVSHLEQRRAVGAEGRSRCPSLRRFSYEEPVFTRRGVVAVSFVGPFRALLSTGLARAVAMVGWGSVGRRPVGLGQPPARSSVVQLFGAVSLLEALGESGRARVYAPRAASG